MAWEKIMELIPKEFVCGHCRKYVASNKGWMPPNGDHYANVRKIYICPNCGRPTFFEGSSQVPGIIYGNNVENINETSVHELYEEARKCCSTQSYTAAILCCRKLLMHIAVSKGAKEGLSFVKYVEYLGEQHYIPPDAIEWVDHIRSKGNEANHEIKVMKEEDAEELINFIEMLLKIIYEFPAKIRSHSELETST